MEVYERVRNMDKGQDRVGKMKEKIGKMEERIVQSRKDGGEDWKDGERIGQSGKDRGEDRIRVGEMEEGQDVAVGR